MEVVLQGVGEGVPHDVTLALNGLDLGRITFSGQSKGKLRVDLPQGLLLDANTVTLTAQDGDSDISLVDHITITYPHSVAADGDQLRFSLKAGSAVQIAKFEEMSTRLFDITRPAQPVELATRLVSGGRLLHCRRWFRPPAGRHTCSRSAPVKS
jgi:hypothetical protein